MGSIPAPTARMEDRWLTLADAARTLGIHASTLRRWADRGEIPVTTTVGGHRRFAASDLGRFLDARRPAPASDALTHWGESALVHTRREMQGHPHEAWLDALDDGARARSREMGQRLMGLLMRYISDPGAPTHLEPEVRRLGHAYGEASHVSGLSLSLTLQATVFFRDALFESALHPAGQPFLAPDQSVRLLRRLNRFVNLVQLAIAETYDAPVFAPLPRP